MNAAALRLVQCLMLPVRGMRSALAAGFRLRGAPRALWRFTQAEACGYGLGFAVSVGVLAGCRKDEAPDPHAAAPALKSRAEEDKVAVALEQFRQGGNASRFFGKELADYREALGLLGPTLSRQEVQDRLRLRPEQRELIEKGLTPVEIAELEASVFSRLDSHHVETCALFRDAAHYLEVPGIGELDQATHAIAWVGRRVVLHQQRQEGLPPAYVLRAGFGSAAERAAVFQAVLHQYRLPTCWIVGGDTEVPLVGVLASKQVFLFDPRRAVPVADGDGIATWDAARKRPELLAAAGLSKEQVARLEARLAVPMESLAPRMEYLESLVMGEEAHIGSERISLFHDVAKEARDFKAAGIADIVLADGAKGTPSPLRVLRAFLPPEEGGQDKTGRWEHFTRNLIPWPPVIARYQQLHIFTDLPAPALENLKIVTATLFEKYYRQPQEMLVRGKVEQLPGRLDRVRTVLEEAEFAGPQEEKQLIELAADWRQRVNEAYLAVLRQDPEAADRLRKIWEDDPYLTYLLQPEVESPRGKSKRVLSRLVLSAVREPIGSRASLLLAGLAHDRAERVEAVLRMHQAAGKEAKVASANAHRAWLDARSGWHRYLDRHNLGKAIVPANLALVRQRRERGDVDGAITQLEYMHLELHHYVSARRQSARVEERLGSPAAPLLASLAQELEPLVQSGEVAKEIAATRELVRAAPPQVRTGLDRRLELLSRDWGENGTFAWAMSIERRKQGP